MVNRGRERGGLAAKREESSAQIVGQTKLTGSISPPVKKTGERPKSALPKSPKTRQSNCLEEARALVLSQAKLERNKVDAVDFPARKQERSTKRPMMPCHCPGPAVREA